VRFCKEAVKVFKDKRLSDTAFIDETIVEESPHPKGESIFNATCRGCCLQS
jgi:hypothetical protein